MPQPGAGAAAALCSGNVPCAAGFPAGSPGSGQGGRVDGVAGGTASGRAAKASALGFWLPVLGAARDTACPVQPEHSAVLTVLQ